MLLLAHSIVEKGHRGLQQAAEASASLSATSRTKLLQVLGGAVILVHAFLLPLRAVFNLVNKERADVRALDSEEMPLYALSLYLPDAMFLYATHVKRAA